MKTYSVAFASSPEMNISICFVEADDRLNACIEAFNELELLECQYDATDFMNLEEFREHIQDHNLSVAVKEIKLTARIASGERTAGKSRVILSNEDEDENEDEFE